MNFKECSFKDLLVDIVDNRGKTCPTAETGIPLIATNCIKNNALYPVFEKVRYVDDETYNNWFRGHPRPGDMIFVCKGSPGRVAWVPDPINFCIAQDMVAIRADVTKVYPKYLFALLRSDQAQQKILNMHVGTLIPHFKKGDFGNLYLDIPEDFEYQKQVGDAYFSFCEKIQLNRQINQTLEQIAQAIFKSWFVDFDPVKAKIQARQNNRDPERAAMCTISGKTDEQLNALSEEQRQQLAATAALFPDALEDSELGEIPRGWETSTIGDEVEVVGGGTPSTKNEDFWKGGEINWTSPKDLSGLKNKVILSTEKKITEAGLAKISSGLLPVDTVLMSSRAPVGYLAQAKIPVAINQGYIAMKCTMRLPPEFVLLWTDSVMAEIKKRASGSTFIEISKKNFRPITVVVPDSNTLSEFQKQAKIIYDKITESVSESLSLSEIRDSLLPKLLSGKISLGESHKVVEEVA